MPSNKQRRDAERLRLQRQLEQRREREVARRRTTLIVSIVGTLVLVGGIIAVIAVFAGSSGTPHHQPQGFSTRNPSPTGKLPTPKSPPTTTPAPAVAPPKACAKPTKSSTLKFDGVTIRNGTDLKHAAKVTATSNSTPKSLECRDVVVGKGKAATPASTVTVQYTGVLYKDGKVFDSSWSRGKPSTFSLSGVVPGFSQGIGGTGKVAPMHVGSRRILILPPALGYGAQGGGPIPPNSTLVFVVDLLKVSG